MKILLVLIIMVANCAGLFFVSLLAAGGDGSSDGIRKVLAFGGVWLLVATLLSLMLAIRGRGTASILVAVLTLPAGCAISLVVAAAMHTHALAKPSSPAFLALCRTAGVTLHAAPAAPVTSIAYSWDDPYPPKFNFFAVDKRGNARQLAAGLLYKEPRPLEFTETRNAAAASDGARGYAQRHLRDGATTWTAVMTAEAQVAYKSTPLTQVGLEPGTIQYDIVVSDRRDGRLLGSLRYFINEDRRRACGTTSEGVMSEVAFVSRAIGLKPMPSPSP